jgi:hypothetical protein
VSICEYIEIDEQCDGIAEYRCTPWNPEGDYLETSHRLVCGDAEHLLQMISDLLGEYGATVDVTNWLDPVGGSR